MAESELKRTHPATVFVKSVKVLWQSLIGLFFVFVASGVGQSAPLALFGVIMLLSVMATVAASWVAWSRFGYGIQGEDLIVVEGLFVRKRRVIPIGRVHGVNMRADIFMRMLGLVEVVVQTAGGGSVEPEAKIGAITLSDAEELKSALLHTREAAPEAAATAAPAAMPGPAAVGADPVGRISDFRGAFGGVEAQRHDTSFEHQVTLTELALAAATSNRVPIMVLVFLGVGAQLVEVVGIGAVEETANTAARLAVPILIVFAVLAFVFVAAAAVVVAVVRDYGFVARRFDRRIEVEAGLLERRLRGIPVSRVQSVRVEESWLRKLFGLATIYVDTAGISHEQEANGGSTALVPALKAREVSRVMHGLLPEAERFPLSPGLPGRAARFYIIVPTLLTLLFGVLPVWALGWFWMPGYVAGGTVLLIVTALIAGMRALAWRAAGIGVDEDAMTMQSGIVGRSRMRISRARIQSLTVTQNPFQRRAGLATIVADSVSGSSKARHRVRHIEEKRAHRLLRWYEDAGTPKPGLNEPATNPVQA